MHGHINGDLPENCWIPPPVRCPLELARTGPWGRGLEVKVTYCRIEVRAAGASIVGVLRDGIDVAVLDIKAVPSAW